MQFGQKSIEPFPPLEAANADGLLAMGGDLSPERLVLAYRSGIFPWFNPGEPILWWSPDPRCVIFPDQFKPSRSLSKSIRHRGYQFTLDAAFSDVIQHCAGKRKNQPGTWITQDMQTAYIALHKIGVAHSAEVWAEGVLVGGLYGIALGRVFFGESMFSHRTDASKVALTLLIKQLQQWGFTLIDCQVSSDHIMSLGAVEIPRKHFLRGLDSVKDSGTESSWGKAQTANRASA